MNYYSGKSGNNAPTGTGSRDMNYCTGRFGNNAPTGACSARDLSRNNAIQRSASSLARAATTFPSIFPQFK
ncbi:hypothetical protein BV898_18756 [Hypsibius exemplaris]|uniref:Uncharacterized protein n=1 Tax=Hypsibius exemplaris TaxID=2072580 RepID=A0A9X6RNG2_HYPEX|nr:hypothetical protein BV898_18756 [Hypsibius exemplaris]